MFNSTLCAKACCLPMITYLRGMQRSTEDRRVPIRTYKILLLGELFVPLPNIFGNIFRIAFSPKNIYPNRAIYNNQQDQRSFMNNLLWFLNSNLTGITLVKKLLRSINLNNNRL